MAELSLKRHYREYPRGGQRERQFSQLLYATHELVFHCVAGMSAALMKKKTNWCTLFITTLFYLEINKRVLLSCLEDPCLGSIHNLPRGWAMMILRRGHSFFLL